MFEKLLVVDTRGHLLGRLASIIARELLSGQKVVLVRAEEVNVTGSLMRNKLKYHEFLKKRVNTNHTRGPFHLRAPAKMLWRAIRGMLPHKTPRGAQAMANLKVFEGVPPPYDKVKRVVVPEALRVLRLKPGRKYTVLGRLSTEVGWKHAQAVKVLEEKRKVKATAYYNRKKALLRLKSKAATNTTATTAPLATSLAASGF